MSATKLSAIPSASDVEIDMEIPVQEDEQEVQEELTLEELIKHLSDMDVMDIMEMIEKANNILKKKWKLVQPKESKLNKPKKPASKALKRNQAWIPFVLKYVTENGWESFTIQQTKKDKVTGEEVTEVVERSGSIPNTIDYSYKDAKTKKTITPAFIFEDTQKHLIFKDAMSLSAKLRYEDDDKKVESDLFKQFLAEYQEPEDSSAIGNDDTHDDSDSSSSSSSSSTPTRSVIRMTSAEKEAEKERKQKEKEEEKEQKRLEREAEKEKKRKEKEEEKEQKRLEREAEKEKKRKEKEEEEEKKRKEKEKETKKSSPKPVEKKVIPAKKSTSPTASSASTEKAATAASTEKAATAASKPTIAAKKPAPKNIPAKPVVFNIPNDGYAHKWDFEGVTYMANSDRMIWTRNVSGDADAWVGIFLPSENRIDTTVPEPEYE
jgi:hypothetical protein